MAAGEQWEIDVSDYRAGEEPIEFHSLQRWKTICQQRYDRLWEEESALMSMDYVVFSKVTKEDLQRMDGCQRGFSSRIFYDSSTELLIVKLMAGKAHEWYGNLFSDLLRRKVETRCGDFWALTDMGSFRCVGLTRQKEPDVALLPVGRHQTEDWPSMVIEVGVLEHLSALHSDAHFWISSSGGRTRVVLLIAIDLESRSIIMERWGDVAPIYPHAAAATPGPYFRPSLWRLRVILWLVLRWLYLQIWFLTYGF